MVVVIAAVMVVLMTASQFITQLQIMSKNQSPEMKASPMYRQQRILLYLLPLVFAFSGFRVPDRRDVLLADLEHLDDGSAVPRHPEHADPGSEAALAREARLAKKNRNKMKDDAEAIAEVVDETPKKPPSVSSRSARTDRRRRAEADDRAGRASS